MSFRPYRRSRRTAIALAVLTTSLLVTGPPTPASAVDDYPIELAMVISPAGRQNVGQPVTFSVAVSAPTYPFPIGDSFPVEFGIVHIQRGGCNSGTFDSVARFPLYRSTGSVTTTFTTAQVLNVSACFYQRPGSPFRPGASALQGYAITNNTDNVAPVVTGRSTPGPNAAGWISSGITISWTELHP